MEFTYYYDEIQAENGEWLLFNVLTGKVLSVSKHVHNCIKNNELDMLSNNELRILENQGFLVSSHQDEIINMKQRLREMKHNSDSLVVTILTNMDCNLGCKYCHENGLMDYQFLNETHLMKIEKWLTKQCEINNYKIVTLYFYGGEPTLNMYAIERIASCVRELSREHGFKYNFSMTTNATLLDDAMVNKLIETDVCDLQVTLDGPRDIHNYRKPFLDGSGTFDVILNNILKYSDRLNFTIRANVDKNNYEYISELMDIIVANDVHKKAFFYLDLVSSTHSKNEYCSNNVFSSLEEMASITYLWKMQKEKGIPLRGKNVIEGLCGNLSRSNITISATGEFYICPGLCGIKAARIGDLKVGYNHVYNEMIKTEVWKNCINCKYLPMCAGGCRAQAYMTTGNCFSCYCKKKYYEKVVMEYIRYKYE